MKFLPALHRAVCEDDRETIKARRSDIEAMSCTDKLGFTALEIAQFLNRKAAISLLAPSLRTTIKAIPKGQRKLISLSEEAFRNYFSVTYLSHLAFADYPSLQKVIANCPWVLAKSFLGEENRLLGEKFKEHLKSGQRADIFVRWIDDHLQYGVFANATIAEGDYIGEFTGVVRPLSRRDPTHNPYCFHYPTRFWSWNYYTIDALEMGNETRYINHSDRPNLQPLCLVERNLLHIVFIAKRTIEVGEQLTYDYGQDYWEHRQKIDI